MNDQELSDLIKEHSKWEQQKPIIPQNESKVNRKETKMSAETIFFGAIILLWVIIHWFGSPSDDKGE